MILDTETLPSGHKLKAKVAVFGSGPAGVSLAKTLADRGIDVILAEGGGLEFDPRSQDLYETRIVGDDHIEPHYGRLRMFGGTSNHWGGYSRPLDAVDFAPRSYLSPHTGWPITKETLDPYQAKASEILEIKEDFSDRTVGDLIFAGYGFSPPVLFNEKYHDEIAASERLTLLVNANFYGVTLDEKRITQAEVRNYDGASWQIEADHYALCLGGIETSRMLLWANIQADYRLVAQDELIGRFWMEHPDVFCGQALLFDQDETADLFGTGSPWRKVPEAFVSLTPAQQERFEVANHMFNVRLKSDVGGAKGLVEDLLCVAPGLAGSLVERTGRTLLCGAEIYGQIDQLPDPGNRVLLDYDRDALGVPKTAMHWHYSDADNEDFLKAFRAFGQALAEADIGRVRMLPWAADGVQPPDKHIQGHYHFMGGTRMSASPETGVVDPNCKVWGCDNLFIGSGSVFPTGGYANSTYTIVQLALRLADHLEDQVKTTL